MFGPIGDGYARPGLDGGGVPGGVEMTGGRIDGEYYKRRSFWGERDG